MGRYINPDQPMSDEDKKFLCARSRGDEVIENERRFPVGGQPEPHESAGYMPVKEGYDYLTQAQKMEDAGGLPIDPIPTDEKGIPVLPEYGYDIDEDGDDLDDDILEKVLGMNVEELKAELKKLDLKTSGNKDELVDRLANGLQDQRDANNSEG